MNTKQKTKETHVCSPHCIYFPQHPDNVSLVEIRDGVQHRKVERYCRFDGHLLTDWATCENRDDGK